MKFATNSVAGRSKTRRGVVDLLDAAAVHDRDPIAHRERFLLVVRHEDERDAEIPLEVLELHLDLLAELLIERPEGLVEEQHLRLESQRPGEGDPLALAARELRAACASRTPRAGRERGSPPTRRACAARSSFR